MPNAKPKILVLESDKAHRAIYEAKFAMEGFRVFATGDGTEGLALFHKHDPDAVLTGLILANTSGYDVIATIRAVEGDTTHRTPVLAISNLSGEIEMRRAMASGADEFLLKSATPIQDIVEAVRRRLGRN